ncbi:MAG: hypothetical protein ABSF69_03600 [Polyangiaceae bacterium]|jgi:hypothetical protein
MDLRADAHVPFPRDMVFAAYRDDMPHLLRYLPNVRDIEMTSRREEGPRVDIVSVWHGGGQIPGALRAVLNESMLRWTDHATWDAASFRCEWRTETHAFPTAVTCSGCNVFVEDGPSASRLEIRGELAVDAKKIRGVPSFVAGKLSRLIEDFLVTNIRENFAETTRGLAKYLAERAS